MLADLLQPLLLSSAFLLLLYSVVQFLRRHAGNLGPEASEAALDRESLADYYRPMLGLLDEREFAFACKLAHTQPGDLRLFRKQRVAAFRLYLDELSMDFRRVEFKLRYLLLAAPAQEADIVRQLNQCKLRFQWQLFRLNFSLFLFQFGWVSIDPSPIIATLERFDAVLQPRTARHHA